MILYFHQRSDPSVTKCTLTDNDAGLYGGGMCSFGETTAQITQCTFASNSASHSGGAIATRVASEAAITECVFDGNTAAFAGAMHNTVGGNASVVGCIFTDNAAVIGTDGGGGFGGAVYNNISSRSRSRPRAVALPGNHAQGSTCCNRVNGR